MSLKDLSNDSDKNSSSIDFSGVARGAASIGMFAAQEVENQRLAKQAQQWTSENMDHAMRNQLTLDRLATPMAVQGMRDAGVGLGALSGPMKPSSQPSAPAGQMAKEVDFANITQALANVRLTNAEARKAEMEANRMASEDKGAKGYAVQVMRDRIEAMKSAGISDADLESLVRRADELEASQDEFNMGNFKAFQAALDADASSYHKITDTINEVSNQFNKLKELKNNADLPYQLKMMRLQLDAAQFGLLGSQKDLNDESINQIKENINLLTKTQEKFDAEIAKLESEGKLAEQQYKQLRNNDINSLLEDGEVQDAMRAYAVDNLADLLKALIVSKGLKGASGVIKPFGNAEVKTLPNSSAPVSSMRNISLNPNENGGLRSISDFKPSKPSPFKFDSPDDRTYKGLAARYGADRAHELYGEWLKNRSLGQSFTDFNYRKWWGKNWERKVNK